MGYAVRFDSAVTQVRATAEQQEEGSSKRQCRRRERCWQKDCTRRVKSYVRGVLLIGGKHGVVLLVTGYASCWAGGGGPRGEGVGRGPRGSGHGWGEGRGVGVGGRGPFRNAGGRGGTSQGSTLQAWSSGLYVPRANPFLFPCFVVCGGAWPRELIHTCANTQTPCSLPPGSHPHQVPDGRRTVARDAGRPAAHAVQVCTSSLWC